MTTAIRPARPVKLRPGKGVLARYEGLTLLFETEDEKLTGELLREAGLASQADQPGRRLGQALTRLLASSGGGFPSLCAFGEVEGGTAALVHGRARLTVRTETGALVLDGRDAVTMSDRIVPGTLSAAHAVLGEDDSGASADPWCEIASGVVRADALWLADAGPDAGLEVESGPDLEAGSETGSETGSASRSDTASGSNTASRSGTASGSVPGGGFAPVPAGLTGDAESGEESADARVSGALCRRGHFNDPSLRYCGVCGLGLTQAGRVPARSERPVLGVLVLDDGTMFPLDRDHVLGRVPERVEEVRARSAQAVRLHDATVAEVHARVSLDGWEVSVTDAASATGTYVRLPGARDWERLPSGVPSVLRPGTVVAVGRRQFRYDSYRKA
ncbi:hypothetical protein HNP84_002012 [Thermocatellispora tengchongensis]|uniref:FHA domain-containing protein n=1 Tax=Thermocatellispora tengchongensis TaxID=1073253 RepID=A0A840P1F5_9ACTN|nr:FHA domain-containing protein [Thermocatellispora tengchongensis]MBB5132296.1 hypothetical protein [Thermocatellispora tengchongensis]